MCIYIYIHIRTSVHIHMYIYICTYTYVHTDTHCLQVHEDDSFWPEGGSPVDNQGCMACLGG